MADEPENHTLHLLREMREETNRRFDEMREEMREIRAQTDLIPKLADDVAELQLTVVTMRAGQTRANKLLETVAETQKNHGIRLNAIHGRLALIEEHTGLVKA